MEIIDNNNQHGKCPIQETAVGRNIYFGIVLIFLGIIWLLENFAVINNSVFSSIFSWQMLVIIVGGYLLSLRNWISGGIVTGVGFILFCTRLLCIDIPIEKMFIPLVFIGIGSAIIGSRLCKR